MNSEEPIQQTTTHAAQESHGRVLGLELRRVVWVLAVFGLTLLPGLAALRPLGLFWAAAILIGPALSVAAFQILFLQDKPPGWFGEWLITRLGGGHVSPLPDAPQVGVRAPIEAYCVDGMVCIPGLRGVLHLARGFRLDVPETRFATNRVRNRLKSCLAQLPGLLAEGQTCMVQWENTNDFGTLIAEYARATPSTAPVAVQQCRNRKAAHFIKAAKAGNLRRERVTLWLGMQLQCPQPTREERRDPATFYRRLLAGHAAELAKLSSPMQAVLAPAGISARPLDAAEVLDVWHRRLNPSTASRRAKPSLPAAPVFSLTNLCATSELRGLGDRGILVDGEHVVCTVLTQLPAVTYPGILNHILTLPIPGLTVTVLLRRLPQAKLLAQLQAELGRVQQQLKERPDPVLDVTRSQVEDKLTQLARGAIVPLELRFILTLHAPTSDALRQQIALLKGACARMNGARFFEAALATSNRNLFLMTLPGRLHSEDPCYAVYAESEYAADLLPVSSSFEAHLVQADALVNGPYGNLIGVRFFVGEGAASTPQHCWVSGATGIGKSYFLCWVLIETAPFFAKTYVLDYGNSHRPLVEATGGRSYIITPDCPWTFNPFASEGLPRSAAQLALIAALTLQMIGVSKDEDKAAEHHALLARHIAEVCAEFAEGWLRRQPDAERLKLARHALALHQLCAERMCEPVEAFTILRDELAANPQAAGRRLDAATDAQVRTFARQHADLVRELAYAHLPEYPTLSSLREHLEVAGLRDPRCQGLADRLRPWCRGGAYGTLFDGQSNASLTDDSPVTQLELGRLNNASKALQSVLWFLLLIVLRQHLLTRPMDERKRIVIEEISRALEVPGAETIIRELFATFRKYRVQCTLLAQQVSQLESETLRSVVLGNVRMAFLFHPGDASDLDRLAQYLPLSEAAKATILKYARPDQLRGTVYSECCYLHLNSGEPSLGTIRFVPIPDNHDDL
jgi:hypothetical protein